MKKPLGIPKCIKTTLKATEYKGVYGLYSCGPEKALVASQEASLLHGVTSDGSELT